MQRSTHKRPTATNAATTSAPGAPSRRITSDADELFAGVPHAERLQLELVVRSAPDQESALELVIAGLVREPRDSHKCQAIIAAFRTNPALQLQWQGAWRELRA